MCILNLKQESNHEIIIAYRKIPKVSPGLIFDIGANLVGLLSGGLTIGWAYFQEDFPLVKTL